MQWLTTGYGECTNETLNYEKTNSLLNLNAYKKNLKYVDGSSLDNDFSYIYIYIYGSK